MVTPTDKSPGIDRAIDSALNTANLEGKGRRVSILGNVCSLCNKSATIFKDDLSRREYRISGLCQKCQDRVFK